MTEKKKRAPLLLRVLLKLILIVVVCFALLIGFLSVTEYKPADTVEIAVEGGAGRPLSAGESFTVMTWNIGYGALGDNADFFMDGGKSVQTADEQRVKLNMAEILSHVASVDPEILFLQEIDKNSSRSHHTNEYAMVQLGQPTDRTFSFANNFKVAFLPYPIPPIGKVDSGVATVSAYSVASARRVQLPIPFSWPIRMANLKRCVLESRVPIEGSDKELVLFNLHLEAYDSGEGKIAQTKMLAQLLQDEAAKGNYVIAGGDFNQIFSSADTNAYPAQEGKWAAGEIDVSQIEGDWQFLMDAGVPSCRSLDQPLLGADPETFQYYLIDGFIASSNLQVESLRTEDLGFINSDHNPVVLTVTLQ